jgi:hypothetical protein
MPYVDLNQLAPYGVKNQLKMLIYSRVNRAHLEVFALSRGLPKDFTLASKGT